MCKQKHKNANRRSGVKYKNKLLHFSLNKKKAVCWAMFADFSLRCCRQRYRPCLTVFFVSESPVVWTNDNLYRKGPADSFTMSLRGVCLDIIYYILIQNKSFEVAHREREVDKSVKSSFLVLKALRFDFVSCICHCFICSCSSLFEHFYRWKKRKCIVYYNVLR